MSNIDVFYESHIYLYMLIGLHAVLLSIYIFIHVYYLN